MKQPLVSILIPFKNTEAFLEECLESIQGQEYQNWEVWAIDDNSMDQSWTIANRFAESDSRINVRKNSGNGIIDALRIAYDHCSGELITRMDADDIMTTNKIGNMTSALVNHGKRHLAVGQVKYFSEKGINNGYKRYEKWLNILTEKGSNFSDIYKECVIPSPCWMVHRDDLDLCGAFIPNRYPEDYDLTFRFYENGLKCIPCSAVLHHWRDYEMRTSRTSEHYAANYFLELKLDYFLKLEYNNNRPLVIWGAGNKGKSIAKRLVEAKIEFQWICDNPKKIGKAIYDITLQHYSLLEEMTNPQSIITVANQQEQTSIKGYFTKIDHKPLIDYFFFC
ncbi:MAG: glycosyltransferase family 2 protein [Maribacter sp.]